MINDFTFKDEEYKDSGVVYKSMLKQVYQIGVSDPAKAGELAISFLEKVLGHSGKIRSEDGIISLIVSGYDPVVERATERYNKKVSVKAADNIEKYHYRELVALKKQGKKLSEIAKELGFKSSQLVSYHWGIIQEKYPELLREDEGSEGEEEPPKEWSGYVW